MEMNSSIDFWKSAVINMGLFSLQFLILTSYFSFKHKRWTNLTINLLGWGDIIFLICICFYLSVINFMLFYISSLLGVILIWFVVQVFSKKSLKHIPLAGLQAILFLIVIASDWWFFHLNLTRDNWLLDKF
jgi:hypothetical protein